MTGTHCSGKTTLCEDARTELRAHGLSPVVVGQVGAHVARRGLPLGVHATEETYSAFMAEHLRNVRTYVSSLLLFDRGVLDLFAYVLANENATAAYVDVIRQVAHDYRRSFDLVFFLRPDFPFVASSLRTGGDEYRQLVDSKLRYILESGGMQFNEIGGDRAKRKAKATALILDAVSGNCGHPSP